MWYEIAWDKMQNESVQTDSMDEAVQVANEKAAMWKLKWNHITGPDGERIKNEVNK